MAWIYAQCVSFASVTFGVFAEVPVFEEVGRVAVLQKPQLRIYFIFISIHPEPRRCCDMEKDTDQIRLRRSAHFGAWIKPLLLGCTGAGLLGVSASNADVLSDEIQDRILKTATGICGEVIQRGGGKELSADGDASLELKGLAKVLGAAKLNGGAKFSDDEYINVLRKNLPAELANVRECRFKVFQQLMDDVRKAQDGALAPQPNPDPGSPNPDPGPGLPASPGTQVIFGTMNWGPYLNCVISNTSNRPVNIQTINYEINWTNGPQVVNQACTYNCMLNAFSTNTFSGPANNLNILSSTCSVTVVVS